MGNNPNNRFRLVNASASPEAKELYDYLQNLTGKYILSGQHNTPAHRSFYSNQAAGIAGSYPAIWGQDFGFTLDDMDGIIYRQNVIDEAIKQHQEGSIITLMWHSVRPIEEEPGTFKDSVCGKLTDDEWIDLVTPGSDIYMRWRRQVDVIADFLKQLQDLGIPVLWRPYHEMNGEWFWWGKRTGPTGYSALWKQLYDRLTRVHKLNNLVWVWNANSPGDGVLPYEDCFPGIDSVDVLACDIYRNEYEPRYYEDLLTLSQGKPIALGEVGIVPSPEVIESQPLWAWFMVWTDFLTRENPSNSIEQLYKNPRVRSRA